MDALETADRAQAALWRNDRGAVSDLLAPEIADEMTATDFQLLWGQYTLNWERYERVADGDALVSSYEVEDHSGAGYASVRMRYAIAEITRDRAVVRATASLRSGLSDVPQEFDLEYGLVRLGGSWRIARVSDITTARDLVFYDATLDPVDVVDRLRLALGGQPVARDGSSLPEGHPSLEVDLDTAVARVGEHYEAIVRGNYVRAYDLLPDSVREDITADQWEAQTAGYGITGAEPSEPVLDPSTGEMVVTVRVFTAAFGQFVYEWRLAERADGWVPVSRAISGFEDSAAPLTLEQLQDGSLPAGHPPLGSSE